LQMKNTITLMAMTIGIVYGTFLFVQMLGALFVVGDNDTGLEVIGVLAYGLIPVPASLLSIRSRWLAAGLFTAAAILWAVGVVDNDIYLQKKFGYPTHSSANAVFLLRSSGVLLLFALFHAVTAWLKWPKVWPWSETSKASGQE
jgi:hypothetical protein